jgi:hypothetical protein
MDACGGGNCREFKRLVNWNFESDISDHPRFGGMVAH